MLKPDWLSEPSVMDPMYKRVIRSAADIIGINDVTPAAGTSVVTGVAKKVAPKRAATELVDLLMGRSKRVPQMVKPLTDEEASWSALHASRTHTQPGPTTEVKVGHSDAIMKPMSLRIRRQPGISAAFRANQKVLGGNPDKVSQKYVVAKPTKNNVGVTLRNNASRLDLIPDAMAIAKPISTKDIVTGKGSVHAATNEKILTTKEINSLLQGPKKAVALGVMSKSEGNKILRENMKRIASQFDKLKKVDQELYRKAMDERIAAAILNRNQK